MLNRIDSKEFLKPLITRHSYLAEKVVFIDGLGGCGKTLFSSLISAFERAEKITYSYEIEHLCSIWYLKRAELDCIVGMIKMQTDLLTYDMMMSRNVNCRPGDLSSIFKHPNKLKYLKRFFQKGDMAVPSRIKSERPIIPITVHQLLSIADPIFEAMGNRAVFIEIIRHPLYMLIQQALNFEGIVLSTRDFSIYYSYGKDQMPWYVYGWEEEFKNANPIEKAILVMEKLGNNTDVMREVIKDKYPDQILTIPFERFVVNPYNYMTKIEKLIDSKITKATLRMLKKQNVPRAKYSDGIPLEIYKRCGWVPPNEGLSEMGEFNLRRQYALDRVSSKIMKILDGLCAAYEEKYMGGVLIGENGYNE